MKKRFLKTVSLILCVTLLVPFTLMGCPPRALSYSGSALAEGTVGTPYEASIATASGASSITYTLKADNVLPAGLSFGDGKISGTPTAVTSGAVSFTVVASAEKYESAEATFSIKVNPGIFEFVGTTLSAGKVGFAYMATTATATGVSLVTYALKAGSTPLPDGLSFSNGTISGTPTAPTSAKVSFTVVASATNYTSKEAVFNISVEKGTLAYSGSELSPGKVGFAYSELVSTASADGNLEPEITYTLKAGSALPAGLTFDKGTISGMPTAATSSVVEFTVVASAENYADKEATFTIAVGAGTLTYHGSTLSAGKVGFAYTATTATAFADGTLEPTIIYTEKSPGSLPNELSFNNGAISGTPTAPTSGAAPFTVVASAANYTAVEAAFSITVEKGTITYSGKGFSAIEGTAFEELIATATADGTITPTITYELKTAGSLPEWLKLEDGYLKGTPTEEAAAVQFTIVASAEGYEDAEAEFTLEVIGKGKLGYTSFTLTPARVGVAYSVSLATAIGALSITYKLKDGTTLPAWLSFNESNGLLSGTPTAVTSSPITFIVVASADEFDSVEATFELSVLAGTLTYLGGPLPNGKVGFDYTANTATATAVGTLTPTITYSSTTTLPDGLSFSNGLISGTPTAPTSGTLFIIVTASATGYTSVTATFTLIIQPGTIIYPGGALPNGKVGFDYTATVGAATADGTLTPPITYSITTTLPDGLSPSGRTISGNPSAPTNGTLSVTVTASATGYTSAQATFTLLIQSGTITYNGGQLPTATLNEDYSASVATAVADGMRTPSITYALILGTLPNGLILSSGGAISGKPTVLGTFTFTVAASAGTSYTTAQAIFTLRVTDEQKQTYVFEAEHTNVDNKEGVGYSGPAELVTLPVNANGDEWLYGISGGGAIICMYQPRISLNFFIISDREVADAELTLRLTCEYMNMIITPETYLIRVDKVPDEELKPYREGGSWGNWDRYFLGNYPDDYWDPDLAGKPIYPIGNPITEAYIVDEWDCTYFDNYDSDYAKNFPEYNYDYNPNGTDEWKQGIQINCWPTGSEILSPKNYKITNKLKLFKGITCISLIVNNFDAPGTAPSPYDGTQNPLGTMAAIAPLVDYIAITTSAQLDVYGAQENGIPLPPGGWRSPMWINYNGRLFEPTRDPKPGT